MFCRTDWINANFRNSTCGRVIEIISLNILSNQETIDFMMRYCKTKVQRQLMKNQQVIDSTLNWQLLQNISIVRELHTLETHPKNTAIKIRLPTFKWRSAVWIKLIIPHE